jgi:hypothetical protein
VEIFELLGATSTKIRFHATAARGLTPFLGREQEYERRNPGLMLVGF